MNNNIINTLDPIMVKSSNSIIIIYLINCFLNSLGILMNIGLIIITFKNKTLQSTCHLLIACCSFCTILLLSAIFIPLIVLLLPALGSLSSLTCFIVHSLPAYGVFNVISLITCIGLDRALSVFFPFWYNYRNERIAFPSLLALSSIFPLFILWLILLNAIENPTHRVVCTLGEMLGDKTAYVAAISFGLIFVSVIFYVMVWVKLKWDMRKNKDNGGIQSRQTIFHSLMIIMFIQVCGWCISNLAFVFIYLLITDPFTQWFLAALFNCFVCIAASTDPFVLLITRQMKKIFKKIIFFSVKNIAKLFINTSHGFHVFIN